MIIQSNSLHLSSCYLKDNGNTSKKKDKQDFISSNIQHHKEVMQRVERQKMFVVLLPKKSRRKAQKFDQMGNIFSKNIFRLINQMLTNISTVKTNRYVLDID